MASVSFPPLRNPSLEPTLLEMSSYISFLPSSQWGLLPQDIALPSSFNSQPPENLDFNNSSYKRSSYESKEKEKEKKRSASEARPARPLRIKFLDKSCPGKTSRHVKMDWISTVLCSKMIRMRDVRCLFLIFLSVSRRMIHGSWGVWARAAMRMNGEWWWWWWWWCVEGVSR